MTRMSSSDSLLRLTILEGMEQEAGGRFVCMPVVVDDWIWKAAVMNVKSRVTAWWKIA